MLTARDEWNAVGSIRISRDDGAGAEINVFDYMDRDDKALGRYSNGGSYVRFNKCRMNWSGGTYPGLNEYRGATTDSVRRRTAVHEFGHALGIGHNTLDDCVSVMKDSIRSDASTCYIPKQHDIDDYHRLWG